MPLKNAVLNAARMTGAFAAFRMANRFKPLVVVYHRFSNDDGTDTTSARGLAEELAYLRAHYTIVPLAAILDHLQDGRTLPKPAAAITIDDGYRDAFEIALPILRRFNACATLFAVTDFIDGKSWIWTDKLRFVLAKTDRRHISGVVGERTIDAALDGRASRLAVASRINEALKRESDETKDRVIDAIALQLGVAIPAAPPPEYGAMSWRELRDMSDAGVVIGSHTVTHPILTQIRPEQLTRELVESRKRLEAMLDRPVTQFCYPNGDYNRVIRDEVRRAGYRLAVTMDAGLNDRTTDPFALRRIHTEGDLTHFIQSTSGFEAIKTRLRRTLLPTGEPQTAAGRP